jgi:hypothetical protein
MIILPFYGMKNIEDIPEPESLKPEKRKYDHRRAKAIKELYSQGKNSVEILELMKELGFEVDGPSVRSVIANQKSKQRLLKYRQTLTEALSNRSSEQPLEHAAEAGHCTVGAANRSGQESLLPGVLPESDSV